MKVLLVDDHPLILAALQSVIRGLGDDVTVAGVDSAAEARVALQTRGRLRPRAARSALGEPTASTCWPSSAPDLPGAAGGGGVGVRPRQRRDPCHRPGAMGFVPKRSSQRQLFDALRLVMSGGIYVPPMSLLGPRRRHRAATLRWTATPCPT
jgi:DNA-binding NarL/FixJ family response regulator